MREEEAQKATISGKEVDNHWLQRLKRDFAALEENPDDRGALESIGYVGRELLSYALNELERINKMTSGILVGRDEG